MQAVTVVAGDLPWREHPIPCPGTVSCSWR